ncbi:MAG TPA: MerR family transcriptional regulator [Thermoanaerobaculia bacterium]|nr:MerR family transcriptional regulator [Thermoanaerobaculia bacterium]
MPPKARVQKRLYYKIGEACKALGIQPYVLRYWETEFSALNPSKSRSGQRVYSEKELEVIRRIKQLLYDEGYTIAGAKKKLEAELASGGLGEPILPPPSLPLTAPLPLAPLVPVAAAAPSRSSAESPAAGRPPGPAEASPAAAARAATTPPPSAALHRLSAREEAQPRDRADGAAGADGPAGPEDAGREDRMGAGAPSRAPVADYETLPGLAEGKATFPSPGAPPSSLFATAPGSRADLGAASDQSDQTEQEDEARPPATQSVERPPAASIPAASGRRPAPAQRQRSLDTAAGPAPAADSQSASAEAGPGPRPAIAGGPRAAASSADRESVSPANPPAGALDTAAAQQVERLRLGIQKALQEAREILALLDSRSP